jgi:hypothetical protein
VTAGETAKKGINGMKNEAIASVIEATPVRLTSDETRTLIKGMQVGKPFPASYNNSARALADLGLMEEAPMETEIDRRKRLSVLWAKAKSACNLKDREIAKKALSEIEKIESSESAAVGFVLTALGKEVANGISVKLGKR